DTKKLLAREECDQALIQALDSSIHYLSTLDLSPRPIHQSKFVGLPAWLNLMSEVSVDLLEGVKRDGKVYHG
ncbi:hypothetical protein Tco_0206758, partial [Tanacetum coccineum]